MVTVIRGAEIYAPERMGRQDILVEGHRISHLGELTAEAVEALEKVPGTQIIDASGLTAAPGPHRSACPHHRRRW